MSLRLVIATHNRDKVREIRAILRRAGVRAELVTMADYPDAKPPIENQPTLEGNAAKKARAAARHTGLPALSDDTGLFVDALKGAPGVYSARYAGRGCTYEDNCRKLVGALSKTPAKRRGAAFRTVVALALPDGRVYTVDGRIRGRITPALMGGRGFGYDPVFLVPRFGKTFAEMPLSLKNRISHRGRAFARVPALLRRAGLK